MSKTADNEFHSKVVEDYERIQTFRTERGWTYILGIDSDAVRRERCVGGCNKMLTVAEQALTEARQHAISFEGIKQGRNGKVGVICRDCWITAQMQSPGLIMPSQAIS